ncbi:NAD-glutamate dehydrogenase [uncultured Endozoicomonas sp.]|uniref:NAD-glutamate dehydrogenase n=1 Tax=uncultured Endozoicomonas sp. TaxID=432652 RepID=UPI0026110CCF|nr:NAD-glutamate dehydrogenase [uncultured Endozoicomonas sp.]
MGQLTNLEREETLDKLIDDISPHLPVEEVDNFRDFAFRYYALDTHQDLTSGNWQDTLGSTRSFWDFISYHDPAAPRIEVINPEYNHHGWHSTHTVVRILHRDMPFVVDSVRMKLNEVGTTIHLLRNGVLYSRRSEDCMMVFSDEREEGEFVSREAMLYLEIDRCEDQEELDDLAAQLQAVLSDVSRVVDDFQDMTDRVKQLAGQVGKMKSLPGDLLKEEDEVQAFLEWLLDDNFTFLGYEEFVVVDKDEQRKLIRPPEHLRGLLRPSEQGGFRQLLLQPFIEHDFFEQTERLSFSKAAIRSSVHRPAYPDFITVRRFDEQGRIVGESRIVGLYTSPVYRKTPYEIPHIRNKLNDILQRSGLDPQSHHGKDLVQILDIYPRDELFQTTQGELFETALSILRIQERKQIKVFIRQDPYGPFCSALVFVPRDIYSTSFRKRIEGILCERLEAEDSEFTTYFSESILARVHFVFKLKSRIDYSLDIITREVIMAAASWNDDLRDASLEAFGEVRGNRLLGQFSNGFSAAYQEAFTPQSAVTDLRHFELMHSENPISMEFYRSLNDQPDQLHLKLYHYVEPLPLADQIPIIENLGLRVIGEYPYLIRSSSGAKIYIHDFLLSFDNRVSLDLQKVGPVFQEAFEKIWFREAENDRFNRLVLSAGLNWRQVSMLRAYARYLKQIGVGFSQSYIAETLCNNIDIARLLVALFEVRFNPNLALSIEQRLARQQQIQQKVLQSLDQVSVLSEDKVVRCYQHVIKATQRTNFYQVDSSGDQKPYISLKMAAREIPDMPKPVPLYEIFVYSPLVEGVHLRGGKVARGGLRWSDRVEDFRTEILGLVKAQQVKNSVIVPVGAKGGFVPKRLPVDGTREEILEEGVRCYKTFIRGLLDITDNLVDGEVAQPEKVVIYDDDDTYLVVAADKGTATFSDIANEIADEYQFWLGDAFASGGSVGYDHKKMGITAKGAWVSVQRHFREQGINVQEDVISAIGIGDMSGDVFGNGMLCSQTIAMVGAFNHLHIFVDPNPDVFRSYEERCRLFALPRSSWADYNRDLISRGGGIFSRQAKSISISEEMKKRFTISANQLPPNELIRCMLRAPVDLLWNGGIGTYIKSMDETHADVGDKANDPLRVNGCEVQAKVIGEGGNLGVSQLGRMEYAAYGGRLNTDFIDNSAGVDCSDHEVNIKILLNDRVVSGDMTIKQRNELLESMTEEVSTLVLTNNYRQTQAISVVESDIATRMGEYRRFMEYLEEQGRLDRSIEFLPDNETITERMGSNKGLTRPELSLLVSYSKSDLKEALLNSDIIDDEYLAREAFTAFPRVLVREFPEAIKHHRLRREIVATQIANHLIDMMGVTFIHRLQITTGASAPEIARAFSVSRDMFDIAYFWNSIEKLDLVVSSELQYKMIASVIKLLRRTTRWLIRLKRQDLIAADCVAHYRPKLQHFLGCFMEAMGNEEQEELKRAVADLASQGVPEDLALMVTGQRYLLSALPVIRVADETGVSLDLAVKTFFAIGSRLELDWYGKALSQLKVTSHWQSLARDSARDELNWQQRKLSVGLIRMIRDDMSIEQTIDQWIADHQVLVTRWQTMLGDIRNTSQADLAIFSVANRELMDLAQVSLHGSNL